MRHPGQQNKFHRRTDAAKSLHHELGFLFRQRRINVPIDDADVQGTQPTGILRSSRCHRR